MGITRAVKEGTNEIGDLVMLSDCRKQLTLSKCSVSVDLSENKGRVDPMESF